jgi:acyl carrier protein
VGSHADSSLTPPVRQKLDAALAEIFGAAPADLAAGLPLGDIDGWDSMNSVTFTMELERVFMVDLGGVFLTADQTVGDVVALLREKGAEV